MLDAALGVPLKSASRLTGEMVVFSIALTLRRHIAGIPPIRTGNRFAIPPVTCRHRPRNVSNPLYDLVTTTRQRAAGYHTRGSCGGEYPTRPQPEIDQPAAKWVWRGNHQNAAFVHQYRCKCSSPTGIADLSSRLCFVQAAAWLKPERLTPQLVSVNEGKKRSSRHE